MYVKTIEVGKLHCVCDTLCNGLDEKDRLSGCYCELEELHLKLAEFHLPNDLLEIFSLKLTHFMLLQIEMGHLLVK